MTETENVFPPLEENCPFCEGGGQDDNGDPCSNCAGTKTQPTDFGYAVLAFLRRQQERTKAHKRRFG